MKVITWFQKHKVDIQGNYLKSDLNPDSVRLIFLNCIFNVLCLIS